MAGEPGRTGPALRHVRTAGVALTLALAAFGCSDRLLPEPVRRSPCDSGGLYVTPINDTPVHAAVRLRDAAMYQDLNVYGAILTNDFRFAFSPVMDSGLVALYGANWNRDDELLAARHMLQGFTDNRGTYHAPPMTFEVTWSCVTADQPDPAHPDSTAHYRSVHVDSIRIVADLPQGADTLHEVGFGGQDFHLVRGDAAVLDSTQEADSLRWYVRRWEDRAIPADAPPVHAPAVAITWGRLKAGYR